MEEALTFGIQFLGAPYVYWKDGMTLGEGPPAWSTDGPPPDKREVFREGLFCCGLVNLMLRHIGKSPPKNPPYDGGTVSYHLRYASQWIPFELHKVQRGDAVFRTFTDEEDQGHIGIALGGPDEPILQCFSWKAGSPKPGVNMDYTLVQSHSGYYYQYIIKAQTLWGTN
eukprot:TRINITY_DN22073_c0_g1_i1.p1 TRINITY_DN22073_c0_g1~~TRINITY_DN22073_c0_g1_i1.p1  ORF type:complete len:169 (-),score=30.83 TRINITY_DN22073_c0_g1_i1:17-523(-)